MIPQRCPASTTPPTGHGPVLARRWIPRGWPAPPSSTG